jgi:hypothetical protein
VGHTPHAIESHMIKHSVIAGINRIAYPLLPTRVANSRVARSLCTVVAGLPAP